MDVTVDPDLSLLNLSEVLEELLDVEDLRVELHIWIDPLTIQVHTSHRITIVSADDSIRIENGNQYESVELSQELGFLLV